MGGRGGSSGQAERARRSGGGDGMGGGTQDGHNPWRTVEDIQNQLGISYEEAKGLREAIDSDIGGFSYGWDGNIRKLQNGFSEQVILSDWETQKAINDNFGGDAKAYMTELRKKAANCEKLIDSAPKWNGGELRRGLHSMPKEVLEDLTRVGDVVDLNAGTASWTTNPKVANNFAGYYGHSAPAGSFVAHVESGTRRGTSIKNLSHFNSEDEVLCSRKEAFQCLRVETRPNGEVHAYYKVVSTNVDWDKVKKK